MPWHSVHTNQGALARGEAGYVAISKNMRLKPWRPIDAVTQG